MLKSHEICLPSCSLHQLNLCGNCAPTSASPCLHAEGIGGNSVKQKITDVEIVNE